MRRDDVDHKLVRNRRIRVLITKIGLDNHDLGVRLVCLELRDAGMEVIYLGKFQTPEGIAKAAVNEDVDVVGISSLASNTVLLVEEVIRNLSALGADGVEVVVGGTISPPVADELRKLGVRGIFGPHSESRAMVEFIEASVAEKLK